MSWIKGFNFRATGAFTSDTAPNTFVPAEPFSGDGGAEYPQDRNGVVFGITTGSSSPQGRNRTAGSDERLRGICFNNDGVLCTFRVDLPAAGDYIIKSAHGDVQYPNAVGNGLVVFRDSGTTLFSLDHSSGFSTTTQWRDATDVLVTTAEWVSLDGGNAREVTFATTTLFIDLGTTTRGGHIAHLYLEQVEAPPVGGGSLTVVRTENPAFGILTVVGTTV